MQTWRACTSVLARSAVFRERIIANYKFKKEILKEMIKISRNYALLAVPFNESMKKRTVFFDIEYLPGIEQQVFLF